MPRNPRVFVALRGSPSTGLVLRDREGREVPTVVSQADDAGENVWVAPRELLAQGQTYTLSSVATGDAGAGGTYLSFETIPPSLLEGDGRDLTPPRLGSVAITAGGLAGHCGTVVAAATLVAEVTDDTANDMLLQLDVTGGGLSRRLFLHTSVGQPRRESFGELSAGPTDRDCVGASRFVGELGTVYRAKVTAWDWAGNSVVAPDISFMLGGPAVSDASVPADGSAADTAFAGAAKTTDTGSCSVAGAAGRVQGASGLGLLLACGGLIVRRIRRRQRARLR